jgi:hypothetical protein
VSGVTITSTSQPTGQPTLNGVTTSEGTCIFNDIKIGSYTFTFSKSNFKGKSDSLNTNLGVTTEKTINLEAEPQGIPSYPVDSIIVGLTIMRILINYKKIFFKFTSIWDCI